MEYLSLAISILTAVFALFIYFKHDSKIKEQTRLINEHQLSKIKSEEENAKKAIVEANALPYTKSSKKLRIYNRGQSTAKNVSVEIPEEKGVFVNPGPLPADISPQNSVEIILIVSEASPDKLTLEITWDDDFQSGNRNLSTIPL